MSITCQATSTTQDPLRGMLVTLECLNGLDHRFHALTDGEGKVKAWFSVCEDLALPFDGSFSHMVGNNDFEWRLCFEIYRLAQENAAIMSIPVTFTINGELRRDIQLVLESSKPQSYSILIEDSPLHSEARVSIANLLHDPATSHKATPQPQATLADTNEMWPSELIRDTCTVSPTQTSGNRATSSGTCEAAAHSAEVTPEEDKEHEKFTEEYFHRLLSWTPSISSQSEVAAAGNHPQIKRKAADTPAATGSAPTRGRSSKRRRVNEAAPRRSQRLRARQLRQLETVGEYIPLESEDEHLALE